MGEANISNVVLDDLCNGCGTCVPLCPTNSLDMILDNNKGIFIPSLNEETCIKCEICLEICPGHEVNFDKLNLEIFGKIPEEICVGNYTKCYTSHSTNKKIRFDSASGGLVTQFLIFALEEGIINGALVTRMSKKNPLLPEPFIARTKEEIIEASQSKYCPVPANIALKELLETPDDEKFAVVGLPCHIHGIRKAEALNDHLKDKIKIHVGIICGTTKNFNGTIYQLKRMNIPVNKVKNINYRGEGWPGKLKIELKDGQIISKDYLSYYDGEFCSFIPWRCSLCMDHCCELSDVSFGDAWIDEIKNNGNIGTSIIITRNQKCDALLEKMNDLGLIELEITESIKVAKSQNMCSSKKGRIYSRFMIAKLFGKKLPVYEGVPKTHHNSFSDYFMSIWYYLWMYISSKRSLWGLFKVKRILARILS